MIVPFHPLLETPRLILRAWRDEDRAPFAALNADPRVMEFMATALDRAQSDAMIDRMTAHLAARGFGLWAVEVKGGPPCIGFVGLSVPHYETAFTPCVEVGWRLAAAQWGRGYATEAARAALGFGFSIVGLDEIVSFTTAGNIRSRRVMERLGLRHSPADDFEHPSLPAGHPLRPHVLYRISQVAWRTLGATG